jgi:DNA-binding CsgD family transcriptional regulator
VQELGRALSLLPVHGPPALERHIDDIRSALESDVALAYGVLDAGDRMDLRFLHGAGNIDVAGVRDVFIDCVRGFGGKVGWAAYNPVRPEPEQRNRVFVQPRVNPLRRHSPIARALYPRFGLEPHDHMRTLVCDGSTFLAWVGTFSVSTLAPWQHAALAALIRPLRRRLIVERRLERHGAVQAALDVLLESTASAVFILGERGSVEPGNGLARAALRRDRSGTLAALLASLRVGGNGSDYIVTELDSGDGSRSYLAIARAPAALSHRARALAAQSRFRLSERQVEVLELLLQGKTSAEIAERLAITSSTLEKHLSALFERAGVLNRSALIARVCAL